MQTTATGYGVLTGSDNSSGKCNEHQLANNSGHYGSLEVSVSTTNSYNRWYEEGYGSDYDYGILTHDAYVTHNTSKDPMNRQLTFDSEGGSGYYGDGQYTQEQNGLMNLDSGRLDQILAYRQYSRDDTEDEQQYSLVSNNSDRKLRGIASTPLVAWNLINLLLSTSLLAFPFVVQNAGYVVFPLMLLVAFLCNYTSRVLIDLMYDINYDIYGRRKRIRLDYVDLCRDAFNTNKGANFVHIVQAFEMLAICVLNICVLGQLGHEILRQYSKHVCTVIAAIIALPTFFIRKLVVIGWMQTIGVISLAIGLLLVQGFCLAHISKWNPSNIPVYGTKYIPIAVGVCIFSFGIQGVMPGLEEQMRKPERFGFVVNLTFTIAYIIQCFFGMTNAMYYGEKIDQVVIIDLRDQFVLGIATGCFLGISILSHFSLPTLVVMEKLDHAILQTSTRFSSHQQAINKILQFTLRISVMTLSVGIALLLPYFAYMMAFIGSTITIFLSLVLPVVFHLKLKYNVLSQMEVFIDFFILLFSMSCLGTGCYFSIEAIYNDVHHGSKFEM